MNGHPARILIPAPVSVRLSGGELPLKISSEFRRSGARDGRTGTFPDGETDQRSG